MNIAFLYYSEIVPERGGVQRVTSVLADFFENQGLSVYYLSMYKIDESVQLSCRQHFFPSTKNKVANIEYLTEFIKSKRIDILINQSGIRSDVSWYAYRISDLNVKVISVINNSILSGIINFKSLYKTTFEKAQIAWILPITELPFIKKFLLFLYKIKYKKHYKSLCNKSDKVIQLSAKFRQELNFMGAGIGSNKILCIPNPVSFSTELIDLHTKKKELLYVGRIDTLYKRVDLLLDIWRKLFNDFPDWQLRVVGDGAETVKITNLAQKMKLERITFEGFQNPMSYFHNASIFCMTSSSESFGLVLLEAMSYGTVPFAFNSYQSVTDIIDHELNGMIIPPFDCGNYAKELAILMKDNERCQKMALSAQKKALDFSIDKIGVKWLNLFDELLLSK